MDKKYKTAAEETHLKGMNRKRTNKHAPAKYQKKYAEIAFDLLSKSDTAKNKSHLCAKFLVSKSTILDWMFKHKEFKEAVERGMSISEARWRDRLSEVAFQPSHNVNNGVIKLLSKNVYGISDDEPVQITINNTNTNSAKIKKTTIQHIEAELIKRGIPVPKIPTTDLSANDE